jgi:diketogulonate reductase-like aldo/keto reductase
MLENKRLLGNIDNLKKALSESNDLIKKLYKSLNEDIYLVKKNTFNCKTWECEYVDKYYFNWTEKKVIVKYDDELDEPKTGHERLCMEEAGILKKIDDTEEFYKKMRKAKKEGAIMRDHLTYKGRKVSCQ